MDRFSDSSFVSKRLGCKFEKDAYVLIRDNSETLPEYIALIHGIHRVEDGCVVESAHLTATKYSLLKLEPLFQDLTSPVGEDMLAGDRIELLLHFTLPESMGTRHDSEVIKIDDIVEAHIFPRDFEVVHCVEPPPGKSVSQPTNFVSLI